MRCVDFLVFFGIAFWLATAAGLDPVRIGFLLMAVYAFMLFWRGLRIYRRFVLPFVPSGEKRFAFMSRNKQLLLLADTLFRGMVVILFLLKATGLRAEWEVAVWGLVVIIHLGLQFTQRKILHKELLH